MEIPGAAKVCPHCRKKQGGGFIKWIAIAFIFIVVAGAAIGSTGDKPSKVGEENPESGKENSPKDSREKDSGKDSEKSQDVEKEIAFRKGEIAELNDVRVTMTDFKESPGSEYNKPSDGNLFLMAEFKIENNSESEIAVSSLISFEAYADDYALEFSAATLFEGEKQIDGTIAAGKKMKGWIGWEVPEDYQNVEIHFTDNVWSSSKFVFMIEK